MGGLAGAVDGSAGLVAGDGDALGDALGVAEDVIAGVVAPASMSTASPREMSAAPLGTLCDRPATMPPAPALDDPHVDRITMTPEWPP